MAHTIRDIMTTQPVALPTSASAADAARLMRDNNIGDVIVIEDEKVRGIVTDRDIVVRAIAAGKDPASTRLGEIASTELTLISPDDDTDKAVQLMRDKAIRRLPVVEDGRPVGFISMGDLAIERDPDSALADVSEAPPNR
jgi:CBS domain-containing protein